MRAIKKRRVSRSLFLLPGQVFLADDTGRGTVRTDAAARHRTADAGSIMRADGGNRRMKTGLKKWLLCTCLCLLLAAAPMYGVSAAGVDSEVSVTYVVNVDQGGGIENSGSGIIDAGRNRPVKTGDASFPMTYLGMVIISAGLIFLILLKNKKDEKEEESAF